MFDLCSLRRKTYQKNYFFSLQISFNSCYHCSLPTNPNETQEKFFLLLSSSYTFNHHSHMFFFFFVADLWLLPYFKTKRDCHHSIEYTHAAKTPQHQRSATHDLHNFYLKINKTKLGTHTQPNGLSAESIVRNIKICKVNQTRVKSPPQQDHKAGILSIGPSSEWIPRKGIKSMRKRWFDWENW